MAMIIRIKRSFNLSAVVAAATATSQQWLSAHLFPRAIAVTRPIVSSAPSAIPLCPECHAELGAASEMYRRFALCTQCGYHLVWAAQARIEQFADLDTFKPIGRSPQPTDFLGFVDDLPYATKLHLEQQKTGLNDAALIGRCRIGHVDTVLAVLDFHFMGGSMGSVVGEQITVAFEYALHHRLPAVTVVNSGGARMQEGTLSLMQMPKTAAAVQRFHASGLLYVSILASPTTGGVFASFANLGDVIIAEPKAIIGFAGPRVAEQVLGQRLPEGSHRAEMLLTAGLIDAIVSRQDLPGVVAALLQSTIAPKKGRRSHRPRASQLLPGDPPTTMHSAWDSVQLARHPDRPTAMDYIRYLSPNFLELQGDRCYGDDPTVVAGLGTIEVGEFGARRTVMFIGEQRRYATQPEGPAPDAGGASRVLPIRPRPEGFRKAIRIMELAAQIRCPLITFIDTIGADPGYDSERHGMAWSLAHCLSTMSDLPTPTITVIIGEGASGGAVVLALADHIMMLQQAIYEVIAPEGAATILYRDAQRTEQIAAQLKLTAADCLDLGIVDTIIPESAAGAHTDPALSMHAVQHQVIDVLAELDHLPLKQLLARRYRKFRGLGRFQSRRSVSGEARLAWPVAAHAR